MPERWIRLDSLHAAGSSLPWIRDAVAPGEEISAVLDAAAAVEPGSAGLLFLPFLMGERAGFSASTPAAFVGLLPQHGRADFARAVLEGVAFELRRMRDQWFAGGEGPAEVRIVGGGVRNELWQQVLADTFNVPMTRLDRDSAYGAAVLAGIGIGWWTSAPEPVDAIRIDPDPAAARAMDRAYARYRQLYDALHRLAGEERSDR
jgi:xylulokinase